MFLQKAQQDGDRLTSCSGKAMALQSLGGHQPVAPSAQPQVVGMRPALGAGKESLLLS